MRAHEDHPVWEEISPEITRGEFRNPDYMDVDALRRFSRIRRRCKVPFRILSDYRSPKKNEAVGGASGSAHMQIPCTAIDLYVRSNAERFLLVKGAIDEGCTRIGIYPASEGGDGAIHLDFSITHPQPRIWTRY